MRKVIDGRKKVLGEDHPDTIVATGRLAQLYRRQKKTDLAMPALTKSVEMHKEAFGVKHPYTINASNTLAGFYIEVDRFEDARALASVTIETASAHLRKDRPFTGALLHTLGRSLLNLSNYTESEKALLEAYRILEAAHAAKHVGPKTVAGDIRKLYESWNKPEELAKWADAEQ